MLPSPARSDPTALAAASRSPAIACRDARSHWGRPPGLAALAAWLLFAQLTALSSSPTIVKEMSHP